MGVYSSDITSAKTLAHDSPTIRLDNVGLSLLDLNAAPGK
jgi:hypothetical protein